MFKNLINRFFTRKRKEVDVMVGPNLAHGFKIRTAEVSEGTGRIKSNYLYAHNERNLMYKVAAGFEYKDLGSIHNVLAPFSFVGGVDYNVTDMALKANNEVGLEASLGYKLNKQLFEGIELSTVNAGLSTVSVMSLFRKFDEDDMLKRITRLYKSGSSSGVDKALSNLNNAAKALLSDRITSLKQDQVHEKLRSALSLDSGAKVQQVTDALSEYSFDSAEFIDFLKKGDSGTSAVGSKLGMRQETAEKFLKGPNGDGAIFMKFEADDKKAQDAMLRLTNVITILEESQQELVQLGQEVDKLGLTDEGHGGVKIDYQTSKNVIKGLKALKDGLNAQNIVTIANHKNDFDAEFSSNSKSTKTADEAFGTGKTLAGLLNLYSVIGKKAEFNIQQQGGLDKLVEAVLVDTTQPSVEVSAITKQDLTLEARKERMAEIMKFDSYQALLNVDPNLEFDQTKDPVTGHAQSVDVHALVHELEDFRFKQEGLFGRARILLSNLLMVSLHLLYNKRVRAAVKLSLNGIGVSLYYNHVIALS